MLIRDSKDRVVRRSERQRQGNRKWSSYDAVSNAEARLRHSDIVGTVAEGRRGLGSYDSVPWSRASRETRRKLVVQEIRKTEEESRRLRATGLKAQGAWLGWTSVESRPILAGDLLKSPEASLSFFLRALSDTLPTPVNLHLWKKTDNPMCTLCKKEPASLRHILSSCKVALSEHRYTWRHNQVLKEVSTLVSEVRVAAPKESPIRKIAFVREGEQGKVGQTRKRHEATGLLGSALDWKVQVDIGRQLVIPNNIVETNLRPDMIVTSESTKNIVLIELTVPWEDRIDEAHELKRSKYEPILLDAQRNGWTTHNFPIEVGCRGFAGRSLTRLFKSLGMHGREVKKACLSVSAVAERCSRWL